MELSWTTFLLEIFNFLVLVWILKRFLYRPVMELLESRRKDIEQKISDAETLHTEANNLQHQYQGRLDEWALEKQHARELLMQELQTEKTSLLEQLQAELAREREKSNTIAQRQQAELLNKYQFQAHIQSTKFAAKLLNSVANVDLENQLINLLITSFNDLNEQYLSTLHNACTNSNNQLTILSAYPLSDEQQKKLENTFNHLSEGSLRFNYKQDKNLVAGLRITIGDWVLRFNIQDELNGFAELNHESPLF